MRRRWIVAELVEPVETITPYGGRAVAYQPLGDVWGAPGAVRPTALPRGDERAVERMAMQARDDPRLIAGRVLRFDGGDWRIETVAPPGEALRPLTLERVR